MRPLLADPALKPSPEHIRAALANLRQLLAIRYSSPLFRLAAAREVQVKHSPNTVTSNALPRISTTFWRESGAWNKGD